MENSKLKKQLNSDEMVLWWSKPCKMPYMFSLVPVVIVSILLLIFYFFIPLSLWYWNVIFYGLLISNAFLLFYSGFQVWDWSSTEYMVTNQRVFFDTISGYAVFNLADVEEVYGRVGLLDRFFGTGKVYVTYEGFDTPTRFSDARGGDLIVRHKPPCFKSIKDAFEVGGIIQNAVAGKK